MERLLERGNVPEQGGRRLLHNAWRELIQGGRDSILYRSDFLEEHTQPALKPQYHITLRRFSLFGLKPGGRANTTVTVGGLLMMQNTVHLVRQIFQAIEDQAELKKLVFMWDHWMAMIEMTGGIIADDALHTGEIEETRLDWLRQTSRGFLVQEINGHLASHDGAPIVNFLQSLDSHAPGYKAICGACEYLKALPWPDTLHNRPTADATTRIDLIREAYKRNATLAEDIGHDTMDVHLPQLVHVGTNDDTDAVTFTTRDNVDITLRLSSPLFSYSGFLKSLSLRNNDKIKFHNVDSASLNFAIRYCTVLEQDDPTSEPRVEPGLPSDMLRTVVLDAQSRDIGKVSEKANEAIIALQSEVTPDSIAPLVTLSYFWHCTVIYPLVAPVTMRMHTQNIFIPGMVIRQNDDHSAEIRLDLGRGNNDDNGDRDRPPQVANNPGGNGNNADDDDNNNGDCNRQPQVADNPGGNGNNADDDDNNNNNNNNGDQ